MPLHHRAPANLLFLQILVNKSLTRSVAAVADIVPTSNASQSETTCEFTRAKAGQKSFVCSKYSGEAPDFVKRVVERGRGDPDDVWFPEVAFHVRGDKLVVQLLRMLVCQDR